MADLVGNDGFQTAALYAAVGAVVAALLALRIGGGPGRNPWAGLVFAGATVAGLAYQNLLPGDLVTALALLAMFGLATDVGVRIGSTEFRMLVGVAIVAMPSAWGIARMTDVDAPVWVAPAVFTMVVVGTTMTADLDRRVVSTEGWTAGLSAVMVVVTVGGVWATVPETEQAVVLVGAAVPVALLGWPRPFASLSGMGSGPFVALVAWTSVVGGSDRHGAVVGGFACLGMFLLGPVLRRLGTPPDGVALLAGHIVLVGVCSRVAGLRSDATSALVIVVVAYVGVAVLSRSWSQRRLA